MHYKSKGTSMYAQFRAAIDYVGIKTDPNQLIKENEQIHMDNADKMHVFDSVIDFLKLLKKQKKTMSICSNRGVSSLEKILAHNKMTQYFDMIISCKEQGFEKPDPTCLLGLVKKYDKPKSEFVLIGDSKTDADFATNAGIDFMVVDQYVNNRQFFRVLLETLY